jgi:hypothetical protein
MFRDFVHKIRTKLKCDQVFLELMLIGTTLGLSVLVVNLSGNKMAVLNLFYLPVVLAAFFLGRYRAGVMAVLCVLAASIAIAQDPSEFASEPSPVVVGLLTIVWGAVLCLTAILVGSLSDERNVKVRELHDAYVGVVEVLSKYLQSANPRLKDRATRVAELCQKVALEMYLPPAQIDDIRVAALMLDLGKIEVTTRLVSLAVETLESKSPADPLEQHSFQGMDLVHSLGAVLKGAIPLLASQGESAFGMTPSPLAPAAGDGNPLGASIIRIVRSYDALVGGSHNSNSTDPHAALAELDRDGVFAENPDIRAALERAVLGSRHNKRQLAMAE